MKPNENATMTDKEVAVQTVAQFKEICARVVKLKECTNTDKKMLGSVYSRLSLKLNQSNLFE